MKHIKFIFKIIILKLIFEYSENYISLFEYSEYYVSFGLLLASERDSREVKHTHNVAVEKPFLVILPRPDVAFILDTTHS
jgi:hypothetical protein